MARRTNSADRRVSDSHYRNNQAMRATALMCGVAASALLLTGCGDTAATTQQNQGTESSATVAFAPLNSQQLYVMDNHDQALPFWVAKGVKGATLVHVDAHDDFRAISDERLAPVLAAVRSGDATNVAELADNEGATSGYNLGDYVYAAVRAGVVSRVIWLVPEHKGTKQPDGWQEWLRDQGFPEGDVAGLKAGSTGVSGTMHGVPFEIVTAEGFRPPSEPVLLDIDTDFFPVFSAISNQTNPLGPTHTVMSSLLTSGIRVQYATVASSVSGDYLDLQHEWLADVAALSLVQPGILLADAPPAHWGAMGEALALEGVDDAVAADRWREAIALAPNEPAPWYGLGRSLLAVGDEKDAIDAMSRAAGMDPLYAYGWLQTASDLGGTGDDLALDLIKRAKGKVSPFLYGVRQADVLYNLKRYEDAAEVYEALSKKYDHPDVWMYLGDSYLALKRTADAERAYLRGMESLQRVTFRSPADYVDALPTLGRLAEQTGREDLAREYYEVYLEKSPEGADADEIEQRLARLAP